MPLNVVVVGGSRNIGYHAAVRLLNKGATVTFLLRNVASFDSDEVIRKYVKEGKAKLVQGDAIKPEDTKKLWDEAQTNGHIDLLLFTVGFVGTPSFSLTGGFQIDPPNLVTASFNNFLPLLAASSEGTQPTKVILLSTPASTPSAAKASPLLLKPMYGWLLNGPAADKRGAERLIAHVAGWEWDDKKDGTVKTNVLPEGWESTVPAKGGLKDKATFCVIRAAMLTDGECVADTAPAGKAPYKVEPGAVNGLSVSRKDVAHFIAERLLDEWSTFGDKAIGIAY